MNQTSPNPSNSSLYPPRPSAPFRKRILIVFLLGLAPFASSANAETAPAIPNDFPRFIVPGHEPQTRLLRDLFYLHYVRSGPMSTLWDEWLVDPSLWPATTHRRHNWDIRQRWARALSRRGLDPDGYIHTHQHSSLAHQDGWPFPTFMNEAPGSWGWFLAVDILPESWKKKFGRPLQAWTLIGGTERTFDDTGWHIDLHEPAATLSTPPLEIEPFQSPFIQFRWMAQRLGNAQPFLEWTTADSPEFRPDQRMYFDPIDTLDRPVFTMVPVYLSPAWQGTITRLRINFDNPAGAFVNVQALFTQYDTRHNVNNTCFIRGATRYFNWTRDLNFLRENITRLRLAALYMMHEQNGLREKCVLTTFVGHCGRSGLEIRPDGSKIIHHGRGIGNNYWDLLPMGHKDAYATIRYYNMLREMADLERLIQDHPEWNIPAGHFRQDPDKLEAHAEQVKSFAGQLFWNADTGRFVCGIDKDGQSHDYGFTFLNCEAIYYDFATAEQSRSIMNWISGRRLVEGDTSQGDDIYYWRFAPRATTRRNVEYYGWFWDRPETIPWGGQVQDGGAVLGFSYHDLMARLEVLGPDNARQRLDEILHWFEEVQAAGGYRAYYKDPARGILQGGGTAGGLGLDSEFFESVLVPQVMLDGFLGFKPRPDGFELNPRLPATWPELTITRIHFHNLVMNITTDDRTITIQSTGRSDAPLMIRLPAGQWRFQDLTTDAAQPHPTPVASPSNQVSVLFQGDMTIRLTRG